METFAAGWLIIFVPEDENDDRTLEWRWRWWADRPSLRRNHKSQFFKVQRQKLVTTKIELLILNTKVNKIAQIKQVFTILLIALVV